MATATIEHVDQTTPDTDAARHDEMIDGIRVETPRMGSYETRVASDLAAFLSIFMQADPRGCVVTEMLFQLDTGLRRRPDLAFVSYDRWPRGRRPSPNDAWAVVPDLAVEVVSRGNTAQEIVKKVAHYFAAGVRLVWVVYPWEELVYVYRSPVNIQVLGRGEDLDGEAVIPGFLLPLATLFGSADATAPA